MIKLIKIYQTPDNFFFELFNFDFKILSVMLREVARNIPERSRIQIQNLECAVHISHYSPLERK